MKITKLKILASFLVFPVASFYSFYNWALSIATDPSYLNAGAAILQYFLVFGTTAACNSPVIWIIGLIIALVIIVYGMVKKRPQELRIGYVGAAALATLPVATDLWLNGGKRYGNLTTQGMTGTYISLIAPPVIAIFAGSLLGNSIASGVSKPTTRKKSWYQGRYARSGKRRVKTQKRAKQRKKLQDKQNKRRD